jgi:membrane protein involved in D-alanine export
MIPYAEFLYFGVLLYVALPTLLLRSVLGFSRRWILLATAGMVVLQYGGSLPELGEFSSAATPARIWAIAAGQELFRLLLFGLFQWITASGFLWVRARTDRRWPFHIALLLAILPLALAKFVPLFGSVPPIGFLGISYISFRSLDVTFGIQDRLIASLPPGQFFAYLFFFPTISSGPIDRYRRFAEDWNRQHTRPEFLRDVDGAVHHVFRGFLYKFILAAIVKQYWMDPAGRGAGWTDLASYMYAYSLYLFFDFAGYSAFAIGLSYLFGVHSPENFDRPFLARNIRDFWNRWHMSLSFWLRDHVYMRFLLAATKGRWFRSKYTASYLAFFLSFGLMGLWHGTEAYYLLYGLYHGALLTGYDVFVRWNKPRKLWGDGPLWRAAGTLITLNLVCFGLLLFSGHIGPAWRFSRAPSRVYEGSHDTATVEEITGWAWDQTRPDHPIDVDIYEGDSLLGTVSADRFRRDLLQEGKGNGKHGFRYVIPSRLRDGLPHLIRLKFSGANQELANTPKTIISVDAVVSMDGLEGVHGATTCTQIVGWAWDSQRPDVPIDLDIYDNDVLLATVPAEEFRSGLRANGKGNGKHGFTYPIPAKLKDGRTHSLRVRISRTNIDLMGTPQLIECPGAGK